jgi:hypothetical protein
METNGLLLMKKIGLRMSMIMELVKMTTLLLILTEILALITTIHTQLVVEATIHKISLLLENAVPVVVEVLDTMKSLVIQKVKIDQLKEIDKVEDGITQWVRFLLWPEWELLDQKVLNGELLHEKHYSNNSTMPWTWSKMVT